MAIEIQPRGSALLRPGGRDGRFRKTWFGLGPSRWTGTDDELLVPFDFSVVPTDEALSALEALRTQASGRYPVIIGGPHQLAFLLDFGDYTEEHTPALLAKSKAVNLENWRAKTTAERAKFAKDGGREWPPRGEWPTNIVRQASVDVSDVRYHTPEIVIGLLPTVDGTEAAAHLKFGNWNECPEPEIHVALARDWRERYGARLVFNSYDTLQFVVDRPIATKSDALAMAELFYLYCPDCIEQGAETLDRLAAGILHAPIWSFWWD